MRNQVAEAPIRTRDGCFVARYTTKGLAEIDFPGAAAPDPAGPAPSHTMANVAAEIRLWHRATEAALKSVLAGRPPENLPPMDPAGTEFQKRVWNALRRIPFGKSKTYGEIAQAIGKPKAVRAVGGACGANPIPVLVPCHRVLAANKKLGGFSGGLSWKRLLLARERVQL